MTYTYEDSVKDQYPQFSNAIKESFDSFSDKPLFTTDVEDLFNVFLEFLPDEARQHYNCNCCRSFINRYGGIVSIDENGIATPVMWNSDVPKFFEQAATTMSYIVSKARVTGVFISSEQTLGHPQSGGWSHMSVTLPRNKVHNSRIQTAGQLVAEKKEDYRILIASLMEYPIEAVNQAVALLKSEAIYRGDRFIGVAKFAQDIHNKRANAKKSTLKENLTWLAVATAPAGFTHIKSSMIGTLLDDIVDGLPVESIQRRFAEKMGTYMRSQSAPTQGGIQQAEKLVAELGIAESLQRRYATFEEVQELIWRDKHVEQVKKAMSGGVFGNITPKNKSAAPTITTDLPTTTMTWDKFQRTVLPTADTLEVLVDNANRLMAIVTAFNPAAPPILQWDKEEDRNPFSWYYHGGIDGEIKRRVEAAGGQYDNNEIRCSLIWENYTDLDLHVETPMREHIYYGNKHVRCGGWLDVDMNAGGGSTMQPVENVRWSQGKAREGNYKFYIHNYAERGNGVTPFKVELEVNGKVYTFSGALRDRDRVVAFEFNYIKGQHPTISGTSYSSVDAWNIPVNGFVKVKGITNSPNLWGDQKTAHIGHHIFFLLEGAKDTSEGKGRGFFTETLKPELREIRKTLEAYTANTPIEGVDDATACGVGYTKDSEWNLVVKVKTGDSTRLIKIDRWD